MILAFGLKPERFVGREGRIDAVLEPPGADEAEVLVQALSSGIEAGGLVIAVLPDWFPPEGALRLDMARSMIDTDRVAVHETALPPLAGAVLCSLASSLAPHVPSAGVLASLMPELEAELHVFTWLGSVSGLSAPAPTFGQHLASLGPSSAFGVSSWPEPSVHKLSSGEPGVPLPEIPRPVADGRRAAQRRRRVGQDTVNRALGGLPVAEVEATPGGPSLVGHLEGGRERGLPGRRRRTRRGPAGRARAVGLPLVPRADRPLAVPAVRPPRPPVRRRAQPHQQGGVPGRWPGRGSCPCPAPRTSSTHACRSARPPHVLGAESTITARVVLDAPARAVGLADQRRLRRRGRSARRAPARPPQPAQRCSRLTSIAAARPRPGCEVDHPDGAAPPSRPSPACVVERLRRRRGRQQSGRRTLGRVSGGPPRRSRRTPRGRDRPRPGQASPRIIRCRTSSFSAAACPARCP